MKFFVVVFVTLILVLIVAVIIRRKNIHSFSDKTSSNHSVEEQKEIQTDEKAPVHVRQILQGSSWTDREKLYSELTEQDCEARRLDENVYGGPVPASRLQWEAFKEFVSSIGPCRVEARVFYFNMLEGGFIGYEKAVAEVSSGIEAVGFFHEWVEGRFRMPYLSGESISLVEIPYGYDIYSFMVELRHHQDKKRYVHLSNVRKGEKPNFMVAGYNFLCDGFIREL
jgi:hypothetical protein